jgi:hypothetical protein
MQNALRALVVVDAGVAAQLLQHLAAVGAEAHDAFDVAPRPGGGAFAQELERPEPLAKVGAQPKQEWGILFREPLEHFERGARVRPRLGVAHGNLTAVREARLRGRRSLAVDDRHVMAMPT